MVVVAAWLKTACYIDLDDIYTTSIQPLPVFNLNQVLAGLVLMVRIVVIVPKQSIAVKNRSRVVDEYECLP